MATFVVWWKEVKHKKDDKKKIEKLSQFSKVHISEMPDAKFGMWGGDDGQHIHWKKLSGFM